MPSPSNALLTRPECNRIASLLGAQAFFMPHWRWETAGGARAIPMLHVQIATAWCGACVEERAGHADSLARGVEAALGVSPRVVIHEDSMLFDAPTER
jgi:hypothetical protein